MEELKKVGYKVISKDNYGLPALIWYCSIKKGNYGPFIAVEKRWVTETSKEKKVKATKYAGKSFNFPIEGEKARNMITSISALVIKAISLSDEFHTKQQEVDDALDELARAEYEGL